MRRGKTEQLEIDKLWGRMKRVWKADEKKENMKDGRTESLRARTKAVGEHRG